MDKKYRWQIEIAWVVEFLRKDAEVAITINPYDNPKGWHTQKVIQKGCASRDIAEEVASNFCENLAKEVEAFIQDKVKHLKNAQP